ncbi:beta-N-acetylhexosaminidase [Shinella sp. SUS2]|uniref:beta-N-acetylhexosaminidase n=1 Tax=unclassified Shinella TaxID=2643062 RepID=UPI000682D7EC|nr:MULTISPECIES: family 20 glycosylhydrolase [unclassified Shinella]KNY15668.1 beta-N-acetylhexosaminidase [Shinella sp. SUS2]KOC76078.1 beta-N-acetylhexosaminidase [Shinella sp. GWS1]
MPAHDLYGLTLETVWIPAAGEQAMAYRLTLHNDGATAIDNFRLCFSGPCQVDATATAEGGHIGRRLSTFTELLPPEGLELGAGASWTVTIHGLSWPFQHWTDGARGAYLLFPDGSTRQVATTPTKRMGGNAAPKRGMEPYPVPARPPAPVSVIPWPNHVALTRLGSAPAGLTLLAEDAMATAAAAAFRRLTEALFAVEGIVRAAEEGGLPVHFHIRQTLAAEAHELVFTPGSVAIHASGQTGFLYGLITLGQIWRGAHHYPHAFGFPAEGQIADAPAMGWRGLHLDVARRFYGAAEIRRLLSVLAWNKLNRFHWHLSDDEAWRVEIDAYPALTATSAWRGEGLAIPPLLGTGAERSGGYYSKAAIRDIVGHAQDYGIEIVPEIDMPGHCHALQMAIPELRDPDERGSYHSVQGFADNCLNPARETTYRVVETILAELIALFPFRTIHIGADEVPIGAWSGSPEALAKLSEIAGRDMSEAHAKRLNVITNTHGADAIEGSGAAALQAIFLRRIQAFLTAQGCTTGGWQEAAHGNVIDKDTTYLCGWRDVAASAALADEGYTMVVCPGQAYYLDMAHSADWDEPGASWAGASTPEMTYAFDPVSGWNEAQKARLLGVQACIWSEPMLDRAVFDRLVFPRLSAVAETGWTRPEHKSWRRFQASAGLMPVLYGAA